ncbi:hypothetical protein M3J09_009227 [Ascochyta lentis]
MATIKSTLRLAVTQEEQERRTRGAAINGDKQEAPPIPLTAAVRTGALPQILYLHAIDRILRHMPMYVQTREHSTGQAIMRLVPGPEGEIFKQAFARTEIRLQKRGIRSAAGRSRFLKVKRRRLHVLEAYNVA